MSTDLLTGVRTEQVQSRFLDGAASWVREHRVDIAIVAVLVLALGWVHGVGMSSFPARFADEGAYMSQAWAVLTRFDLGHYTYWYDHPPLGWLILAAYTGLTGSLARAPYAVAAGRGVSIMDETRAAAMARSAAGSCTRRPPATLR